MKLISYRQASSLALLLLLAALLVLSGCASSAESADEVRHATLENVDTVEIDHGSTPLQLEVAEIDSLQASLLLPRGKGGIIVEEEQSSLNIRLKDSVTQILNLGKKPQLHVVVPSHFKGKVVVKGSSGNVKGKQLQSHQLDIRGKSGNVVLEYAELNNDLTVSLHSGNVSVQVEEEKLDANWLLQTKSGRRSIGFPLDKQEEKKGRTAGITGAGSVKVELETKSGNITVNSKR